jgi:hypothetical protein
VALGSAFAAAGGALRLVADEAVRVGPSEPLEDVLFVAEDDGSCADEEDPSASAAAIPLPVPDANAAPMPNATASPPIRPIFLAALFPETIVSTPVVAKP